MPTGPDTLSAVKVPVRVSPAVARAAEVLAARPRITPAELASELRISASYARTLMRRARLQSAGAPAGPTALPNLDGTLHDLQQRLALAERDLAVVRAMPAQVRTTTLNLNRRAEVLRLLGGGLEPELVAERLAIPQGEVEFIAKVDRMVTSSV